MVTEKVSRNVNNVGNGPPHPTLQRGTKRKGRRRSEHSIAPCVKGSSTKKSSLAISPSGLSAHLTEASRRCRSSLPICHPQFPQQSLPCSTLAPTPANSPIC